RRELVLPIAVAAQKLQRSGGMPTARVCHGAQKGELVSNPGMPRQELTEVEARHGGRNRAKGAAELPGRVGLGVVGLEVTGAPAQPDQDHCRGRWIRLTRRFRTQPEKAGKCEGAEATQAGAQECAPG